MLAEQYKPIYTLLPVMTLPGERKSPLSPNDLARLWEMLQRLL